ncbi:histidine phosphatase family protein [Methylocella tundrae]|uniref:phosphoglycerate mutase (2,3-diphosphoglycerate-dependent) n=1 Tax=Methylocella tundrae TaxID=227605 RepID=A0A4V6IMS1_METTU|nr:histidine phosphatase family protein [Methylocella tundrae]WPP03554.1 histidine phosphatase family protein [Methylocella tundrae]VFU09661.1 Histidine phosphatase family protein [Methylocella tundrae]
MPTRFCLIRHGETAWNAAGRLQGHVDIPLNDVGRAQAKAAARTLATLSFNAIYSSDLARALQTATDASPGLGLDIVATPALRERCLGAFQGLTHAEAQARYPSDYARFRAREPDHAPPGGESLHDFSARIEAAFTSAADQRRGETVLVVTHGGVLDVLRRLATGQGLQAKRDFPLLNAALNWIERRDGRWLLLSWGETAHLEAARDEVFDAMADRTDAS